MHHNERLGEIINLDDHQVMVKHYESHYSSEVHSHDYSHLVFIHQGCQIISTDKDSLLSMPGSLIYIPAGVPHRADALKQSQVSLLRLPLGSIPELTEICILDISPIVTQLFSLWENGGPKPKLEPHYIQVLMDQCTLCKAVDNPLIAKEGMDRRLLPVIDALSNKPSIKLSISDLSKQTGASVRTLNRLFLTSFKASFREIRQKVVMERAEKMMAKGISATEIAFELEYSSLSAFSTAFKEHQKKAPQN